MLIIEFVRDAFVLARGFTFITGPQDYPESLGKSGDFCMAVTAVLPGGLRLRRPLSREK